MSEVCAQRLGLERLIDYRVKSIVQGVGSSKIVGRVHNTTVQLGKDKSISISIDVIAGGHFEFLFGLDNMREHKMCIDLENNVLRCKEATLPFLSEDDMKHFRVKNQDGDEVIQSAGVHVPSPPAGGAGQ